MGGTSAGRSGGAEFAHSGQSRSGCALFIGVIVLLAVVGAGLYFYNQDVRSTVDDVVERVRGAPPPVPVSAVMEAPSTTAMPPLRSTPGPVSTPVPIAATTGVEPPIDPAALSQIYRPTATATPTRRAMPLPMPAPAPTPVLTPMPTVAPLVRSTDVSPPDAELETLRQFALALINEDRAKHGLPLVIMGTNAAAQLHAEDMLANDYKGHWWADGRTPYMVYSQTGGTSYMAENSASSGWTADEWMRGNCDFPLVRCNRPRAEESIERLQWGMMYDDAHAYWGHRDNILDPNHRAVNIGIAWNKRRVTFIQHFEGGDVKADAPPAFSPEGVLTLSLSKLAHDIQVGGLVTINFDPIPIPMTARQIDALDSYCVGGGQTTRCGEPVVRILDPPGLGRFYSNLDHNEVVADTWVETDDSYSFTASVGHLIARTGVYTVTVFRDSGTNRFDEVLVQLSVVQP